MSGFPQNAMLFLRGVQIVAGPNPAISLATRMEHSGAQNILDACDSEGFLEYCFDTDEEMDSMPSPGRTRDDFWGHGYEALRASPYHQYDASRSPIFRFLQRGHAIVTRRLLMELIDAVVKYTPEDERPRFPARNQRRAKNGLILWLDQNSVPVWRYLKAQFPVAAAEV
jgi:hypothetical protein